MTDDDLRAFLNWPHNPYPFEELSDEWKAWAGAIIESAQVSAPTSTSRRGPPPPDRPSDNCCYLCRLMLVLESLQGEQRIGITVDDLRGKFISGLVASGFPAHLNGSSDYYRAVEDARHRGLIASEYRDCWQRGMASGSGWQTFYRLELSGKTLAEEYQVQDNSAGAERDKERAAGTGARDDLEEEQEPSMEAPGAGREAAGESSNSEPATEERSKKHLRNNGNGGQAGDSLPSDSESLACLSPAEIASKYGVPQEALQSRLRRWRKKHGDGWRQVTNHKPREPQYLYEVRAIWSVIKDLRRATSETTSEQPAK